MKKVKNMAFYCDQHTLYDLQIFPEKNQPREADQSVFGLFSHSQTDLGRAHLKWMLRNPSNDREELDQRTRLLKTFSNFTSPLSLEQKVVSHIDYYLKMGASILPVNGFKLLKIRLAYLFRPSSEVYNIFIGIKSMLRVFFNLKRYLKQFPEAELPANYRSDFSMIRAFLQDPAISKIVEQGEALSFWKLVALDDCWRSQYVKEVRLTLQLLAEIDAYQSIVESMKRSSLTLPLILDSGEGKTNMVAQGIFHPLLAHPVKNDLVFSEGQGLCLLLGPNMAGKSTFLKSLGVTIYLAHCGFPVPAASLKISVFDGLITTINLNDNLSKGYSHFYSEVERLKQVINTMQSKGKIVAILDELFRGTNYGDAFEGSYLVAEAFSKVPSSKIFISTHIVAVIEKLVEERRNVLLHYFEAAISGKQLSYDYRLQSGYSTQRLGMHILKNEAIFESLEEIKTL